MSTGGVFTLISNTGIQDKLIMATDQLLYNVKKIGCNKLEALRQQYPDRSDSQLLAMDDSWMPTLAAIETTHILYVNATYKPFVAMAHEYSKTVPRGGVPSLGGTAFSFTFPIIGDFINDAVMYIRLTGLSAKSSLDKVRYVEFLGHRLMKTVKFKVQNQIVDQYDPNNMNAYYQFKLPLNKTNGYLRNIGQEIPKVGLLTADPAVDEVREYRYFGDGPQTFKQTQPDIEMWIPLLFWFKDIQCSLPNFILPMNQTEVEITLESESNLVAFADYGGGGAYNPPKVADCSLYLNHIFLLPEITRIFITRFGFQLIRVHRNHLQTLTSSSGSVLLQQLKWPLECLYVGFRPQANLTNSQRWYKNTYITSKNVKEAVVTGTSTIQVNNAVYLAEQQPVQLLGLVANSITIYPDAPPEFYNNYTTYRYGSVLKTPDYGWYMLPFNQTPGEYQPSGHFNCSKSRELYLKYTASIDPTSSAYVISDSNPTDLIVLADAINFVLFKDGNMVLRFST